MNDLKNIDEAQIREILTMQEAILLMTQAFVTVSTGRAIIPLRSAIDIVEQDARVLFMPVYVPELITVAVKIVSVYPGNTDKYQIPNIHGKLLLIHAENGVPYCLLDAEYITALRTGAASGLATDILANENAKVLAIFGTGAQAFTQVEGVMCVRNIETVLVFGTDARSVTAFCEHIQNKFKIQAIAGNEMLLKEADIICTATNSKLPVFDAENVKKGCHINAIGSFKPDMQELPAEIVVLARLFVDQIDACMAEAGDIVIPLSENLITPAHILGELGEVIAGNISGRENINDITIFKSVGNAVQDVYVGYKIFNELQNCNQD